MKKIIVIGVIALFICVGFQSAFAVESNVSVDNIKIEEDIEPKDYLFETIVAIANNPEVKELFEQYKDDWSDYLVNLNFHNRYLFFKILVKNPSLFNSILFTKSVMSHEYLNSAHTSGCEIINIIGEEKAFQILESVELVNPDIVDKIANIISNNEELYNRITILSEMNENYSIICDLLLTIWFPIFIHMMILGIYASFFPEWGIIYKILEFRCYRIAERLMLVGSIMEYFDCPPLNG